MSQPKPAEVLRLFRSGCDTCRIAWVFAVPESLIANILAEARDAERQEKAA
ncbi:MAG TPA: hypothetical protein VGU45_01535 [Microvirga sp.]|jgi:hypothetical protein|nr:hypothetical protein [Microvirga sp.]